MYKPNIIFGSQVMELERIAPNKTVYREKGKTITVIREFSEDVNYAMVLDALLEIIEMEERGSESNEE